MALLRLHGFGRSYLIGHFGLDGGTSIEKDKVPLYPRRVVVSDDLGLTFVKSLELDRTC